MASLDGLTFLIGGARSGKSSMAVELGRRHGGPVTVIATLVPDDDALVARVTRHRAERPEWPTIEAPHDLVGALGHAEGLAIVDCLTLWVSNLMLRGDDDEVIDNAAVVAAEAAAQRGEPTVVISNEVGLGVHPETELGLRYRDVLGRVNQHFATSAETSLLLVAGRALALQDPWSLLA
jgi:adenosylcobinamide kinase / adenosylcobinamide-phosphate guanylyltransferase